jgi:hypothetical protein
MDAAAAMIDAAVQMMDAGAMPSATASAGATATVPDECNQYAVKQQACIAKMPPAMQGPATATLNAAKASWPQQAASNRAALQATCKSMLQGVSGC